jgi:(p)ppGpp synthase/HD superfamily hydrolase
MTDRQAELGERFERALDLAFELHRGQSRKGSGVAYFGHLLGVASIVIETGGSEDEAIAALLHDAIEDVDPPEASRAAVAHFGHRVLAIVEGCTDADTRPKPPWRERKERYLARMAAADASVLLVSASDKLHNARSLLADLRQIGDELWKRFTASREESLWYYRACLEAYRANPRHRPQLVAELERTVDELERVAKG